MMELELAVAPLLDEYFEEHGRYPSSLDEVPLEKLGSGSEGSSASDLESWRYSSDGTNFTLSWTGEQELSLLLLGRTGQIHYGEFESFPGQGENESLTPRETPTNHVERTGAPFRARAD